MNTLYGITNLQVYATDNLNEFNHFLLEHNGNIVDIQLTDKYYQVVYKSEEEA